MDTNVYDKYNGNFNPWKWERVIFVNSSKMLMPSDVAAGVWQALYE